MPRRRVVKRDGISEPKDRGGYIIQWTDFDGRRKRRTVKVASREAAQAALSEERKKVEQAHVFGQPLPSKDSFEAFAAEFLKLQENRISPRVMDARISRTEYERQRGIVETKLIPFFGKDTKLAMIRRADVVRYIDMRTGKVSAGSIIKEVNTLKGLFTKAVELEKIAANPAAKVKLPKAPKGKLVYLTPEQWQDVFRACYIPPTESDPNPAQWLQWAAGLAIALGTRRGELMHTRIPDVDLGSREVVLRHTKNGEERTVYINGLAMQVFKAMGIDERKKRKDRGVLFPGIDPAQLSMRFIRAARLAGVENVSFHTLRHTFASHLRMRGADLHDIQKLLGHSDLRMTDRYAHLSNEHLAMASARLDGVLTLPAQNGGQEPAKVEAAASPKALTDGLQA